MDSSQVAERLSQVYDPDLGIDVVSLGLVYGIDATPPRLLVTLTMTSPSCPLAGAIVEAARTVLRVGFPTAEVEVVVVDDPPWDPGMMSGAARRTFGLR